MSTHKGDFKDFTHAHGHTGARAHERRLNVLIACEESQAECKAFRELGHNAFSCDIQKCRKNGNPQWHIHDDATPYIAGRTNFTTQDGVAHWLTQWDLIICHPPCTYLCRQSACQLYRNADGLRMIKGRLTECNTRRYDEMLKGRAFFLYCLNANAKFVAVENPVPMALAQLPRPSFFADPSWFGVKYTKKTCYWVKNLPPLMGGLHFPNPKSYVNASRGKYRSRTFRELAHAIADQWSAWIINEIKSRR